MKPRRAHESLSQIQTLWGLVQQAHAAAHDAGPAQAFLLKRYGPAALLYLRGALRDAHAADDLYHDFVLRFLRGGFRGADPGRGRFRDYLKAALRRLVLDHRRRDKRRPKSLAADAPEPETQEGPDAALDRDFLAAWREQLFARTWGALEQHDRRTHQPHYLALRFQADHPELSSHELAEGLGGALGRAVKPDCLRQWLTRGRAKFADLFLDELAGSLRDGRPEALEQELIELGLLDLFGAALRRRREKGESALEG
jgi:RNA polymerase sigma factor (sigma-70 family)